MLQQAIFFLVTCVALCVAIRVDFNTNKGPIVPAKPRPTVRPHLPYRLPAPVWENQENDIPNPNPYKYVLPPPSRPRPATNNYLKSDRHMSSSTQMGYYIGHISPPNEVNSFVSNGNNNNNNQIVSSLSSKYIPNVGYTYGAVVQSTTSKNYKNTPQSASSEYYSEKSNKLNGKYNAKTKKHKAFEKVKYLPQFYYSNALTFPIFHYEQPEQQDYQPQLPQFQQLPSMQEPQPFRLEFPRIATQDENFGYNKNSSAWLKKTTKTTTKSFNVNSVNSNSISSFDGKNYTGR